MFVIVLIPLWFAVSEWRSQRRFSLNARGLCADLAIWRSTLRSAGIATELPDEKHAQLLKESVARGFRCASALADAVECLRSIYIRAEKANRLRLLWIGRLAIVIIIASVVRCSLLGALPAMMVNEQWDGLLVLAGCSVLIVSTVLFFRTVPALVVDQHGVAGFQEWLWNRILVDNGCLEASLKDVVRIEQDERDKGISMREEKLEVLAAYWRTRMADGEAKTELATEWLPVFEFVGFGSFLIFVLMRLFVRDFL